MAHYFISDVHLRLDKPDRAERLARFVAGLEPQDHLVVAGDLCDFWMASRETQRCRSEAPCPGLQSLAEFHQGGGELVLLPGNHDAWLGEFYAEQLGVPYQAEPYRMQIGDVRVHIVHGHLQQDRWHWKRLLETRAFFGLYSALPSRVANPLSKLLDSSNDSRRPKNHERLKRSFREYAKRRRGEADLFLFGHVHERVDESIDEARLIVLGDWKKHTTYLALADGKIDFVTGP